MTDPTQPRAYPATPAYGAEPPTGNPFLGGVPNGPKPAIRVDRTAGVWLAIGMSLVVNAMTLIGVLAFGWPPGNVFLLFWAENVVLGLCTLAKVATAQGEATEPILVNGRPTTGSPGLFSLFFLLHYGIFCLVHLVFTLIVAVQIGFEPTFLLLGFPLILIVVRYTVETWTTWFGRGELRRSTTPRQAMMGPYPRIIVLQISVILAFSLVIGGPFASERMLAARERLAPFVEGLPEAWRTNGVGAVAVLVLVKTAVDIITTRRALRPR